MIGHTLSHYEILEELGRGGMGIVYKAVDTKLDRAVAIKVLPSAALSSEEDRVRFYREAKAAAQLHHPHIASVFQIDEAVPSDAPHGVEPSPFIAMELVEGETLEARIKKGPLKLEDAVRIAAEIASALELAHKKGIVHRDVKSQNVMLAEDGAAKVLDFGLAQTAQSTRLTRMGSTLGTIAFMSPEQARGEEVDHRTDLWSLGVVLYEMTCGRIPFPGDYEQAAVYSILNEDPEPLTALRTGVPMELERIVNKCLAKQAASRYQTASDLIVDLKGLDFSSASSIRLSTARDSQGAVAPPTNPEPRPTWKKYGFAAAGIAVGILLGYLGATMTGTLTDTAGPSSEIPVMRLRLPITEGGEPRAIGLSPDGTFLAYLTNFGNSPVYRYDLATGESRQNSEPLSGTALQISPDGQWILIAERYSISRVSASGGSLLPVADTPEYADASWSRDGRSVFVSTASGLAEVELSTGETKQVTSLDSLQGELSHKYASLLPDNRTLMFSVRTESAVRIAFVDMTSGQRVGDIQGGVTPKYLDSGHLLYLDDNGTLLAVPFDAVKLRVLSAPVAIMTDLSEAGWTVSRSGTLMSTRNARGLGRERRLVFTPATGATDTLGIGSNNYDNMRLSPDGKILAVQQGLIQERDVWIYDLESNSGRPLSVDGNSFSPTWSPDGQNILYVNGPNSIVEVPFDGSRSRRILYTGSGAIDYPSLSPDGNLMTFTMDRDVWLYDEEDGARLFVSEPELENQSRFSPDGKYLALTRVVSGLPHIFVHSISDASISWDVSQGEGLDPYWSENGRTIFYRTTNSVMRVSVTLDPTFRLIGNPQVWLDIGDRMLDYAVIPDESGIIRAAGVGSDAGAGSSLDVFVNLFEYLEEVAPAESGR